MYIIEHLFCELAQILYYNLIEVVYLHIERYVLRYRHKQRDGQAHNMERIEHYANNEHTKVIR